MRVALMLALAGVVAASGSVSPQEQPVFSSRSELVVLHVNVEEKKGRYISGLPQDAFTVFEDGQSQPIRFFNDADTPATIGLLIDNSTSMRNRREMVVASALGFTAASNPEDEIFVLAFNEHVSEIWSPRVIRDSNMASMRATLTGGIAARGRTALYDALARGLDRLAGSRHTRQVLVVLSDGGDNASGSRLDDVLARTEASNAAIFTVALRDPLDDGANPKLLRRIAKATGGEAFEPEKLQDVPETLEHIAHDIRSAYTIGYEPTRTISERTLRKLRVTVRLPNGRTVTARTRTGYMPAPRSTSESR